MKKLMGAIIAQGLVTKVKRINKSIMNKNYIFDKAIEITKEYARSGHSGDVSGVFKDVYKVMKEISEEDSI